MLAEKLQDLPKRGVGGVGRERQKVKPHQILGQISIHFEVWCRNHASR